MPYRLCNNIEDLLAAPHTAEYKKTNERESEKRKQKQQQQQLAHSHTHTHHKMLSSICVLRSVRHAPNLCAFNCKRPLVTPFFCGSCLSCCCCCWHVNVLRLLHRVWPLLIATPQPKLFAIFALCFVLFSTVGHRSVLCFLFPFFCFCFPLTTDHCKKVNACGYALNCCQFLSLLACLPSFSHFTFLGVLPFFVIAHTHY